MYTSQETAIAGIVMEDRWNELSASRRTKPRPENGHPNSGQGDSIVFYKDMRFWLILIMLSAFFVFTLVRFP